MIKIKHIDQKFTKTFLVVLLLFLAFAVRLWKIEYIPNATDGDEMAYIFAGQSLLEFGIPISWSSFEQPNRNWTTYPMDSRVVNEDMSFPMIKPWLDHTFFLPLIAGGWSELGGYSFGTIPPALWYRLPMLAIAMVTLVLAFFLAKDTYGYWPAVLSLLLLSFSPAIIIIQRMVVTENLIIPFLLAALLLYQKKQALLFVIIASVLAALAKPTGLAVLLIITFDLILKIQWKTAIIYTVSTLSLFLVVYLFYLSVITPDIITSLLTQSHRLIGWSNPAFLLASPGFQNKIFYDFSYYLLLLSGFTIFLGVTGTKERLLSVSTLVLLVTTWVASAEFDLLGWYKIPLFVILAINAGRLLKEQKFIFLVILVGITILSNLGLVRYPTSPLPEPMLLRAVVGSLLVFLVWLLYNADRKRIAIVSLVIMLSVYVGQSFFIIHSYFGSSCRDKICPTPTVTLTQLLKDSIK